MKSNYIFFLLLNLIGIMIGCKETKKDLISSFENHQEIPTLSTDDVSTLVSDSGVTKYRITAPKWIMYDKSAEPYWYFPASIFVEKFDSLYQAEASIASDTAYFYKNKKLWHLIGNVKIKNEFDERFETEELFWDQRSQRIYSDLFIRIEKKDVIIEGNGFESNESITKYTIRTPSGIFPIQDKPITPTP